MRHPSPLPAFHQHAQRPSAEITLLNSGGNASAVSGPLQIAGVFPFRSLPHEPRGALQALGRASFGGHPSAPEFFADRLDERFCLRFALRQFANRFQQSADGRDQDLDAIRLRRGHAQALQALCIAGLVHAHGLISKLSRVAAARGMA